MAEAIGARRHRIVTPCPPSVQRSSEVDRAYSASRSIVDSQPAMTRSLDLAALRGKRATDPGAVAAAAARRARRPLLMKPTGRLMIIAADHPARGALGVRGDRWAMADREELLARLVAALARPGVDGVLGTADLVEDLLLLGALEGKVVLGSMNRGGLHGAAFEIDDRFTGYDVESLAMGGLDGGKMLCRIDLDDPASVRTLEACAAAIGGLARHGLMALVEPFMSHRTDSWAGGQHGSAGRKIRNDLTAHGVLRAVAIAAGLGTTSAYTWLKLPVVQDMERVMSGTTLPTLLLGGDPDAAPDETYTSWEHALALPGVRGLVVGRSLLYPPGGDVAAAVDIAASLVHEGGR